MGLFDRTIGLRRAEARITLANLAYDRHRLTFHERRAAMGKCTQNTPTAPKTRQQAASGYLNAQIAQAQPKAAQISRLMEGPSCVGS